MAEDSASPTQPAQPTTSVLHEVVTPEQQPLVERKGQGPLVQPNLDGIFPLGRSGVVPFFPTTGTDEGQGTSSAPSVPLVSGNQPGASTDTSSASTEQGNAG